MKTSRFSEEQIITILKEQEAGRGTRDVCRDHGISVPTFYNWKAKYGGMQVSQAQRLRQLETENSRLKRVVADMTLDIDALKEVLGTYGDARISARGCGRTDGTGKVATQGG